MLTLHVFISPLRQAKKLKSPGDIPTNTHRQIRGCCNRRKKNLKK